MPPGADTSPLKIDTSSLGHDKDTFPAESGGVVDSADVAAPPSPTTEQSHVEARKSGRSRARTSSSGMLSMLTSRASVASPTSTEGKGSNGVGPPSPSLDRAALEKPRGKYKSGANWNVPGLSIDTEEPFMETADAASPTGGDDDEAKRMDLEAEQTRQMLEAGGTAAAKAHASRSSIGAPYFPSQHRQAAQHAHLAAAQAAQRAFQHSAAPVMPGAPAMPPISVGPRPATTYTRPAIGPNGERSTPGGVDPNDPFVAEAAQRILAAARAQAAGAPVHAPASHAAFAARVTPSPEESVPEGSVPLATVDSAQASGSASGAETKSSRSTSPAPSLTAKATKRRTFLGFGVGSKDKKQSSSKSSSRRASRADLSMSSNASTPDVTDTMSIASGFTDGTHTGTTTPNGGTVGRRRRYKDTRQLDLLAAELAAETLLGQQYDAGAYGQPTFPGSLTPEARRASMMSVLGGANNGSVASLGGGGALGGSALLAPLSPLTAPQPAFASPSYGSQGSPGSSRNSSPRVGGTDLPRFDARRSISSLGLGAAGSPTGSPYATQKAKLTGLPSDMLTGLGDGPYPSLPHGGGLGASASVDPFGIPTTSNESPYDVSTSYANRINVYHSPASRRLSSSSGGTSGNALSGALQMTSSAPYPPSSAKRSVLTMSMHSPETESQGLTKPLKSGRTTPFASRAGSRTVTPKTSMGGMREKAAAAATTAATISATSPPPAQQQPAKEKKEELNKVTQALREQVKASKGTTPPSPSPPPVESPPPSRASVPPFAPAPVAALAPTFAAPAPVPVPTPVPAPAPQAVKAATPEMHEEEEALEEIDNMEGMNEQTEQSTKVAAATAPDVCLPSKVPTLQAQSQEVAVAATVPSEKPTAPQPKPDAPSLKPAIALKPPTSATLSPTSASITSTDGRANKPKLVGSSSFSRATARLSFFGGKKDKASPSPAPASPASFKAAASPVQKNDSKTTPAAPDASAKLATLKGAALNHAKPASSPLANGAGNANGTPAPYVPSSRPQPTSPQQGPQHRQQLQPNLQGQGQQRPPQQMMQSQRPPQQEMNGRPPMPAGSPPPQGAMRAGPGFVQPPPGMMIRPPPGAPGAPANTRQPPPSGMLPRPPPGSVVRPTPHLNGGVARPPPAAGQQPMHPLQRPPPQRQQGTPRLNGASAPGAPPSAAPKQPMRRPGGSSAADGALAAGPKSGSKLSRFMARFAAKPAAAAPASTLGKTGNGAVTHANGGSGSLTPRDRTASLPNVPPKTAANSESKTPSLAPPIAGKMTPTPSQEDLRIARAYLNPEMSARGFGTRSAYVTSSSGGSARTPSRDSAVPDLRGGTPSTVPTSAGWSAKDASSTSAGVALGQKRDSSVDRDDGSRASASASSRSTDETSAGVVTTPGETPHLGSNGTAGSEQEEDTVKATGQIGGIAYALPLKAAVA